MARNVTKMGSGGLERERGSLVPAVLILLLRLTGCMNVEAVERLQADDEPINSILGWRYRQLPPSGGFTSFQTHVLSPFDLFGLSNVLLTN